MSKKMVLDIVDADSRPLGTLVRSVDNVREPNKNVTLCRVTINGERFNGVVFRATRRIWPGAVGDGNKGGDFWTQCVNALKQEDLMWYKRYVKACHAENLEAYGFADWEMRGKPTDAIGGKREYFEAN